LALAVNQPGSVPQPSRSVPRRAWAVAAVSIVLLTGILVIAMVIVVPRGCVVGQRLCEGLRLEGSTLALGADLPSLLNEKASEISLRNLEISIADVPAATRSFTLGELGVNLDVARMTELARAVGHAGSFADRLAEARRARRGEIDVARAIRILPQITEAALGPLKDEVDEVPIPARVNLKDGGAISEVPGLFLDVDDAVERIRAAAISGAAAIKLQRVELMPKVTREFVEHVATGEQLSRFQTWFSRKGDQETRAQNIDTATARLDGVVLLPQELFSFNAAVGPRTTDNGFSKGWEIFKGEMVEGIGGGTCQVASTLHAAALLAGFDIIERLPHSRPSAYITMGLDATVVYPVVDLKLRNPYDFPVVVHGWVEGGMVAFELLGQDRPARVTFGREVVATRPFARKVDEKPGIPWGRAVHKQHGIRGYKILRTRTIAYRDGTARRETNIDFYPPTSELYLVAPGFDADDILPPFVESPDPLAPPADPDPNGGAVSVASATPSPTAGAVPANLPTNGAPPPAAASPAGSTATAALPAGVAPPATTALTNAPMGGASAPFGSTAAMDPHVIEGPGVHPPKAEQPKRIVIHTAPLRR
jgi:vancomycin resistance protein YoaR